MKDPTEKVRAAMVADINSKANANAPEEVERRRLEAQYGKVWTSAEVGVEFEVLAFLAPFTKVRRKSDGVVGTLMFQHSPRFYFSFEEA